MIKRFALAILILLGGIALPLSARSASAQTGGSLAGSVWILSETAVQWAAFTPALGNPAPTLTFSNDGKISGDTGCNSYGGLYTQNGNQITVSEVVQTLRACVDDTLNKQEQLMMSVLKDQVAVTATENTLSLSNPAGTLKFVLAASTSGPSGNGGAPGVPSTGNGATDNSAAGFPFLLLALPLVAILTGALYVFTRRSTRTEK